MTKLIVAFRNFSNTPINHFTVVIFEVFTVVAVKINVVPSPSVN
jgi:hypothetical protein